MKDSDVDSYLREIHRIPTLTADQESALALQIAKGSQSAVDRLAEAHLAWVADMAIAFYEREAWRGFTLGEAIHAGNTGLLLAVRKWKPLHGHRFATYAKSFVASSLDNLKPSP